MKGPAWARKEKRMKIEDMRMVKMRDTTPEELEQFKKDIESDPRCFNTMPAGYSFQTTKAPGCTECGFIINHLTCFCPGCGALDFTPKSYIWWKWKKGQTEHFFDEDLYTMTKRMQHELGAAI